MKFSNVVDWKHLLCIVLVQRKKTLKVTACRNYFSVKVDGMNFCNCHARVYTSKIKEVTASRINAADRIRNAYILFKERDEAKVKAALKIQEAWREFYKRLCKAYVSTFIPKYVLCTKCINHIGSYSSMKMCDSCKKKLSYWYLNFKLGEVLGPLKATCVTKLQKRITSSSEIQKCLITITINFRSS